MRTAGKTFPPYPKRPHSSGQARIKIAGRHTFLGVWGSPESWGEYRRRLAAWQDRQEACERPPRAPTRHARTRPDRRRPRRPLPFPGGSRCYTNADGSPKPELQNFDFSLAPLLALYGGARPLKTLALRN